MKKTVALTAAGSLVALGGAAFAQEQSYDISWIVEAHDIGIVIGPSFDIVSDLEVTGWSLEVDYVNVFGDSSWMSDLELKLTNDDGDWVVGQNDFDGGDPFGPEDEIWDFDGAGGQPSGHYSHTSDFGGPAGDWNVMLAESWDGGVEYNNMILTLHQIPAPGALALLGVAGLVGGRRRRK